MNVPDDRRYLPTHEWHLVDGDVATIGITRHAADELTDITFVELPEVGAEVKAGEAFGEIESVKATADLNSGVSGTVVEVNSALKDDPGLVNRDPYHDAWMIKVRISSRADVDKLLTPEQYSALLSRQ